MLQRIFVFSFITLTVLGAVIPRVRAVEYNPRSLQRELFDRAEFVRVRRGARADRINKDVYYNPPSSSSSRTQGVSSSVSTYERVGDVRYEDLSSTERDALRTQLRSGGCPQKAHEGYTKLCESLLRLRPKKAVPSGVITDKVLGR